MLIYKLLRAAEWTELEAEGHTAGAPIDRADGYIHFSTAEQLPGTIEKHFAGERDLMLLAVEADELGDALAWEPSRGGELFPHLYRLLARDDVAWVRRLDAAPLP